MRTVHSSPSRRWCREVLQLRHAADELLAQGAALTDPRILRISRRLDRLVLDATWASSGPGAIPAPRAV